MSDNMQVIAGWVETFREDVNTVKKLIESDKVDDDARRFAATALNYLVTRMDLIPDWTETIGVIDDVLVLRVCVGLASAYGLDDALEEADAIVAIGRLGNEADRIAQMLGDDMEAKLRKFCARLSDSSVRGRTAETVVKDAAERTKLYQEIEDDLNRMPAASFARGDDVERRLTSYLHAKLKDI